MSLNLRNPIVRKVIVKHALVMAGIAAALTVAQDLVKLALLEEEGRG